MDFGIRRRSCNQSPVDTKEQLSIWGSLKLYADFQLHTGLAPLTLMLLKGQLYLQPSNSVNKALVLSVLVRTFGDKQPPPDNLNSEKGFVQEILGMLMKLRSEIGVRNSLESKSQTPFISAVFCFLLPIHFILLSC